MTENTENNEAAELGSVLRLATLVIGSVEVILATLFGHLMLQSATSPAADEMSVAIGTGMAVLIAAPILFLTMPGLLLAWLDRAPRTGLALVLLALPVAGVLWLGA
jgi:hypothetical protein